MEQLIKNRRRIFFILIMLLFIIPACEKDEVQHEVSDIDVFIWNGLRQYYLWVDQVPELDSDAYDSDSELVAFLNSFNGDHEGLFKSLLYQYDVVDKWSWIMDDYQELEDLLRGTTTSMGYEFGLRYINGSSGDLFGYVRYVIPGTPAGDAGMQRGQLFLQIDGTAITAENYSSLLFGSNSYEIYFADVDGSGFVLNGETAELTAEVVHENPIHHSEIIDVDGIKVAYLVYNGFTSPYDHDLNDLFAEFKTENIQQLILDLRYNGGGSVRTAAYLASMIYDTDTELVLSQSEYNTLIQEYLLNEYGESFFKNTLRDKVEATDTDAEASINTLNLDRVYVLTTNSSASASELIINGLDPFMDVIIVGTNTSGKYAGSITIKDYDGEGNLNRSHRWAMQPIVFKTSNSLGVSDYVDGFAPSIEVIEDVRNILPFGDENEPLLKAAIDDIRGLSPKTKSVFFEYVRFKDSKDMKPFGKEMFDEIPVK